MTTQQIINWLETRCKNNIEIHGTDKWNKDMEDLLELLKPSVNDLLKLKPKIGEVIKHKRDDNFLHVIYTEPPQFKCTCGEFHPKTLFDQQNLK